MASMPLFIDITEIKNDTQLSFQKHKTEKLIEKQIDLEYGLNDIMLIITLLVALGSMIFSLIDNQISATSLEENKEVTSSHPKLSWFRKLSFSTAYIVLISSLSYGIYAQYKKSEDRFLVQQEISQTISAIEYYEQQKELSALQNKPPILISKFRTNNLAKK